MNKYTTIIAACTLQLAVFAPGAASAAEALPPTCEPVTKEQVAALFDRWNAALQTKNADEVVKNYEIGAVLLPTVSNKPRTTPGRNQRLFRAFPGERPKRRHRLADDQRGLQRWPMTSGPTRSP